MMFSIGAVAAVGCGEVSTTPDPVDGGVDAAPDGPVTEDATPSVGAGRSYSCRLRTDGAIRCWGDPNFGNDVLAPPTGAFAVLEVGVFHSCALRGDGTAACWGENNQGEATPPAGAFVSLGAGNGITCGVREDGTGECWGGDNAAGRLAVPDERWLQISPADSYACGLLADDNSLQCWGQVPPDVLNGSFTQISSGFTHTCGVTTGGTILCFGDPLAEPVPGGAFAQLDSGRFYSCALAEDGTVDCWGESGSGQTNAPSGTFVQVTTGAFHSCAIVAGEAGDVVCWGEDIGAPL